MKPTWQRGVIWLLVVVVLTASLAGGMPQSKAAKKDKKVKVRKVKVTNVKQKKLTLTKGETFQLKVKVKVKPNKKKYKKVRFISSNKKVASVTKKGKIKAKKKGNAKISVISKRNKKKKVVIRVKVEEKKKQELTPTTPVPSKDSSSQSTAKPDDSAMVTVAPIGEPTPTPTPAPDGTSTMSRKPFSDAAYVGDTLADVEIQGGSIIDSNGNEIEGSYQWENPEKSLESSGKIREKVTFIPKDESFETITGISILVPIDKRRVIVTLPKATAITTKQTLASSTLTGGSAVDEKGNTVEGIFEWSNETTKLKKSGTHLASANFIPTDSITYREAMVYVNVSVSGTTVADTESDVAVNISAGTWKNATAYGRAWAGDSYCLDTYLADYDLSQYGSITVTTKQYDASGNEISGNTIACKLSTANWGTSFAEVWTTESAKLSLENYTGESLYLIVQNISANIEFIEITSLTLNPPVTSNISDGSSLKNACSPFFGKVGMALEKYQINSKSNMEFGVSQYNSLTMGNEMKPDYLLGSSPTLQTTNPEGYVDTNSFTYPYQDSKYPVIDMEAMDSYIQTAYDNGMKMRFHVFIWHTQTPKWFFKENYSSSGEFVTPDVMNGRLEYLMRNVMTHIYELKNKDGVYIGREVIDSWDIANEYFHNYDKGYKSYWDEVYYPEYEFVKNKHSGILTPIYIKQAFALGHSILENYQLEDSVNLLFNEFNTYMEANKIVTMIQYFNTKDEINPKGEVICDGIGMQMHLDIGYPTVEGVRDGALEIFRKAGLVIEITEFDMTDYSKTTDTQLTQMLKWYDLMKMILAEKDRGARIEGITWWGPADNTSWRADGVPLLFSDIFQAKEHYYQVMQAISDYNENIE